MTERSNEMKWLLLLTKLDSLNRRVKEPGWSFEDKQEVYRIKDRMMEFILGEKPEALGVDLYMVPYYAYSQNSKDKAGDMMRRDFDKKPFEYYLSLIPPGPFDREIPEKATVEIVISCAEQIFSFHQPMSWYIAHGGNPSSLTKKAWISAINFHHQMLENWKNEIASLQRELAIE